MNQKGIFKRKFFSVVVFYQVQWLHVFGEVFRQESSHQSEKVIVQAMMDLFVADWTKLISDLLVPKRFEFAFISEQ